MIKRSIWSGVALIVVGVVFLAATNSAGRSSKLGLIVGALIILSGVVRIVMSRRAVPPPP